MDKQNIYNLDYNSMFHRIQSDMNVINIRSIEFTK